MDFYVCGIPERHSFFLHVNGLDGEGICVSKGREDGWVKKKCQNKKDEKATEPTWELRVIIEEKIRH